jgi:hypothetical protein
MSGFSVAFVNSGTPAAIVAIFFTASPRDIVVFPVLFLLLFSSVLPDICKQFMNCQSN